MNEKVAEVIRAYSSKFGATKVFFAPGIPPKKLQNAIKTYASSVPEKEVLVLIDTSLFGSAKDGLLINEDALYVHGILQKPRKIAIKDIQTITLEESDAPELETMDVHVNDPQFCDILSLDEKDAPIFTQMLKEIQAALVPAGTGSTEDGLVVRELARVPWVGLIRMVPIEGGRIRKYKFINLHLKGKEYGKVENSKVGLFSHPKVMLEMNDNKVVARTEGNDVLVNGEPLVGKRELAHHDRIALGKESDMALAVYQFQADPKNSKELRQKAESSQATEGHAPGQGGGEKPTVVVISQFVIDQKGFRLINDQGGRKLSWGDMDEVLFSADYDFVYKQTTNLGNAAGQGLAIGAQTAASTLESQRLSDRKAVFPAPFYKVEFRSKGDLVEKLEHITQRDCAMIDVGIELFSPIDLVKFK
jgi:hypothetical protein